MHTSDFFDPADNYSRVPNNLLDHLAHFYIPGAERRILDYVIRQTIGWHTPYCVRNLNKMADATGMQKPNICRAVSNLSRKNILVCKDSQLSVNPNLFQWQEKIDKKPVFKPGDQLPLPFPVSSTDADNDPDPETDPETDPVWDLMSKVVTYEQFQKYRHRKKLSANPAGLRKSEHGQRKQASGNTEIASDSSTSDKECADQASVISNKISNKSESEQKSEPDFDTILASAAKQDIADFEKSLKNNLLLAAQYRKKGFRSLAVQMAFEKFMSGQTGQNEPSGSAAGVPLPDKGGIFKRSEPENSSPLPPREVSPETGANSRYQASSPKPKRLPFKSYPNSDEEMMNELKGLCAELDSLVRGDQRFNPYACMHKMLKQGFADQAVAEALDATITRVRLSKENPDVIIASYWGYVRKIAEVKSKNHCERSHIARSKRIAKAFDQAAENNPEMAKLAANIG